ncbi:MAG: hypothetical protein WDN72_07210 [Alphaproteobacteria bacterium]
MTRAALILLAALLAASACGVQRPLIQPSQVPEYEARRAKRLQQMQDDTIPLPPDVSVAPQRPPVTTNVAPEPAAPQDTGD